MPYVAFAILAGYITALPFISDGLPFDPVNPLTVAGTLAVVGLFLRKGLFKSIGDLRIPLIWILFAAAMLPAYSNVTNEYGSDKVTKTLILIPLLVLWGTVAASNLERLLKWIYSISVAASVITILAIFLGGATSRWETFGSAPITVARLCGFALVGIGFALITGERSTRLTLLLPLILVAMISTGSRGPIAFALLALGIGFSSRTTSAQRSVRFIGGLSAGGVTLALAAPLLPGDSTARLFAFFEDENRSNYFSITWDKIVDNPVGLGFGSWEYELPQARWPHNLILELAYEASWAAALLFIAMAVLAFKRLWRHPNIYAGHLTALLAYTLLSAMTTGDIVANRIVFFFLAAAMSFPSAPLETKQTAVGIPAQRQPA